MALVQALPQGEVLADNIRLERAFFLEFGDMDTNDKNVLNKDTLKEISKNNVLNADTLRKIREKKIDPLTLDKKIIAQLFKKFRKEDVLQPMENEPQFFDSSKGNSNGK